MAATSHRKLSRKELRRPDEFVSTLDQISEFVANNLTSVIVGAMAMVAVVAVGFGVSFYSQHQRRIASEQFYSGITALRDKDYKSAAQDFGALTETGARGELTHLAHFYMAMTYLSQHQTAKARDELRAYLSKGTDGAFRQLAFAQLGVTDEDLGDYREAHAAYADAAQLPGPEKAGAEVSVARTLALLGDRNGAVAAYQRFLKENPFAPQRSEVVEALAQMGVAAGDQRAAGWAASPAIKNAAGKEP
jgi:predicted negative regulator of RcsB-dependent stress response